MGLTLNAADPVLKEDYMAKAHPGFASVQNKIAKQQGVSQRAAGAILAKSSRNASAKAKKANPRLRKVGGDRRAMAEQMVADQSPKNRKLLPKSRLKGGK